MAEPGAIPTYAAVAAGAPVAVLVGSIEHWLGITVAVLTIAVLVVRLCVDIPRAWRKWRERSG